MASTQFGVTPPISTATPKESELVQSQLLVEELRRQHTFEGPDEARLREKLLGTLLALTKQFVYKVSLAAGMSHQAATEAGGKIFTFGSYRLGVHGPASDIDCLCVVPKHVKREDFFTVFEDLLRETDGIGEITSVPNAYVPIIATTLHGVELDLLFARLMSPTVPEDLDLKEDAVLRGMDDQCQRSLNGSRVTDLILHLVPNVNTFRTALRCIKLWAKRKAIYSNVNGFLGGVAWAMLVARICQLFPNACDATIVSKFFSIYLFWQWPQPVLLKKLDDGKNGMHLKVWNPALYPADRAHIMPIITPAFPSMCSTHNVMYSTKEVMHNELRKGADLTHRIMDGKAQWEELFKPHNFFEMYKYYLQVISIAEGLENYKRWSGTVESKLRLLVMKLENSGENMLSIVHPFINGFENISYCVGPDEISRAAAGETILRTEEEFEALDEGSKSKAQKIYTKTFYVGLEIKTKIPGETNKRRLDISYPTADFLKQVKAIDTFDETTMGISIRHVKASDLPDDVFGKAGRPAPAKKLLKRKSNTRDKEETVASLDKNGELRPVKKLRAVEENGNSPSSNYQSPGQKEPAPLPSASVDQLLQTDPAAISYASAAAIGAPPILKVTNPPYTTEAVTPADSLEELRVSQ